MDWKNINFFGYDPEKDDFSKTTFNIKRALNDNWEHVKELIEELRIKMPTEMSNDYTDEDKEKVSKLPEDTNAALNDKIDKVTGKGLSTNDFTDAYKATLDNLPDEIEQNSKIDAVTATRYGLTDGTPSQAFERAVQVLTATIPAAGWSAAANTDGWYTNQVNIADMKAVYNPVLDLVITTAALAEE